MPRYWGFVPYHANNHHMAIDWAFNIVFISFGWTKLGDISQSSKEELVLYFL
jgi:hypothetical protein